VLQRFLAEDSGSAAGLAWLRGARAQCAAASARRLEQRRTRRGRAEWAGPRRLLWEEERTTSLSDRQHEEMTHGAAATCVVRGADVAADQQRRHEVVAAAEQLSCARRQRPGAV
jgi:hypothetical protein